MNMKQTVTLCHTVRARHRTAALAAMFSAGNHVPSLPIVRVAYEDWLACASWLALDEREIEFRDDRRSEYARPYSCLVALCGKRVEWTAFPVRQYPDYAKPYLTAATDPLRGDRDWRGEAVELGLVRVHDVAHNHSFDLSRGSRHTVYEHVGVDEERVFERSIARNPVREDPPHPAPSGSGSEPCPSKSRSGARY